MLIGYFRHTFIDKKLEYIFLLQYIVQQCFLNRTHFSGQYDKLLHFLVRMFEGFCCRMKCSLTVTYCGFTNGIINMRRHITVGYE